MWIDEELAEMDRNGLRRTLRSMPGVGGKFCVDGKPVLNLCSNDYLDLANDPRLKSASAEAIHQWGCGSTASRLMCGHLDLHDQLESALAELTGYDAALVFGSGFLTNLGVITAMAHRHDEIFADRLNHASLVDGAAFSGAKVHRYPHVDTDQLESMLRSRAETGDSRSRAMIVSDSLFSMDGDVAPLTRLRELADEYGAMLMIDEAHAIGVVGAGRGAFHERGSAARPDLLIGTLGKALGSYGGFVACSKTVRDYLVNRARSFIYSTALPPASVAAALAAVSIVGADPAPSAALLARARSFRAMLQERGFELQPFESQIIPVLVGDNRKALELATLLSERGILVKAIRPPTVPAGTARLRLSVTLAHTKSDLEFAADEMADAARQLGML